MPKTQPRTVNIAVRGLCCYLMPEAWAKGSDAKMLPGKNGGLGVGLRAPGKQA